MYMVNFKVRKDDVSNNDIPAIMDFSNRFEALDWLRKHGFEIYGILTGVKVYDKHSYWNPVRKISASGFDC